VDDGCVVVFNVARRPFDLNKLKLLFKRYL
jgi:hypothetical protein